jgi:diguanylate cyclase (GGDEF)-like protein
MAEKIRARIESYKFSIGKVITASFGVAEYSKDKRKVDLLKEADKAMYKAKESGRNRVHVFT